MNDQQLTAFSITENLQSKSNLSPKPNLPPKPRFRTNQTKLKVAPRPGEAKQSIPRLLAQNSTSNLNKNVSSNPSNASSSNESISLNQSSKVNSSSENNISLSTQERNVNLNNLEIDEKQNQPDNHDVNRQFEKDVTVSQEQSKSVNFPSQTQNTTSHEINSTENNNVDIPLQNPCNNLQSVPDFPPISIPPPPFKPRQFKYPSGNLAGTCDFQEFDKKLDEMLRLYQAPRLRKY